MATREQVDLLGMMISEAVLRLTGFGPSKQLSNDFANNVYTEAHSVGYEIQMGSPDGKAD